MISISGGTLKGRRIKTNKIFDAIKPTKSLVRESLFNILGERILKARFLDVFAGTGVVGIEAFSRGADEVFFIEKNKKLGEAILVWSNLLSLFPKVLTGSFHELFFYLGRNKESFDIIFMDPPYAFTEYGKLFFSVKQNNLLRKQGVLVLEHHKKTEIGTSVNLAFQSFKTRFYGTSVLAFYTLKDH